MIDGVKCSCVNLNADVWRNNPLLDFGLWVSETTGETLTARRLAKADSLQFIISPTQTGGFSCSITGSLHKFKNKNGMNWNDFTFSELCRTLDNLSTNFNIQLDTTFIHSIEIGVNMELDFNPYIILKSVICHKGKAFNYLDKKDKRLGLICEHTDYAIKLYDKGHQSKISERNKYVLRFEVKLHRHRLLNPYDIATLNDLKSAEKVAPLISLLLERLDEIIFFDFSYKPKNLSKAKAESWQKYSNPNYWANLNFNRYYKARKKYAELIIKYNCIDWAKFVSKRTTEKWVELAELKQKNRRVFPQVFEAIESRKKASFSNLEYVLENLAKGEVKKREKKRKKNDTEKEPCCCITCGRQLTGQKTGSRFCSEKIYGKDAKKCRNKDSNRRLSLKRKINRAMEKEKMLRITYKENGQEYTDILGANEILVTREWLDKIVSIDVLEPQQKELTGKGAKEYLLNMSENSKGNGIQ